MRIEPSLFAPDRTGAPEAIVMDRATWDRLIADLRSDDPARAVDASIALRDVRDPAYIDAWKALIEDACFFVRETAAWPLGRLLGIDALPPLLRALDSGERGGEDVESLAADIVDTVWSHP